LHAHADLNGGVQVRTRHAARVEVFLSPTKVFVQSYHQPDLHTWLMTCGSRMIYLDLILIEDDLLIYFFLLMEF
jgi:hypothetical protein